MKFSQFTDRANELFNAAKNSPEGLAIKKHGFNVAALILSLYLLSSILWGIITSIAGFVVLGALVANVIYPGCVSDLISDSLNPFIETAFEVVKNFYNSFKKILDSKIKEQTQNTESPQHHGGVETVVSQAYDFLADNGFTGWSHRASTNPSNAGERINTNTNPTGAPVVSPRPQFN